MSVSLILLIMVMSITPLAANGAELSQQFKPAVIYDLREYTEIFEDILVPSEKTELKTLTQQQIEQDFELGLQFEKGKSVYISEINTDGEKIPVYICDNGISPAKALKAFNEVKEEYLAKSKTEKDNSDNSLNEISNNYNKAGTTIIIDTNINGVRKLTQEYRWYYGGKTYDDNNNLYYLCKDLNVNYSDWGMRFVKEYKSDWIKYNENYSIDFLDPTPTSKSNINEFSLGIPVGYTCYSDFRQKTDIHTLFDRYSDNVIWTVTPSFSSVVQYMKEFQFTQGVYIISDKSNIATTVKDVTTIKVGSSSFVDTIKLYIMNNNSTVGHD